MASCRSCGASVVWVETEHQKAMPIDAEPSPKGNLVLEPVDASKPSLRTVHVQRGSDAAGPRYLSHFSTCPQARKWRR